MTAEKHTANRKKGKEMRKRILTAAACVAFAFGVGQAQELKCTVEVNSSKIEGSSKSVFETLKQSLTDYMNETKFTNLTFSPVEKIECRLYLTVG